ncbi:MAG: DUF1772 domain-containing protein [Gammaproteobacteria bacterium]|nr:DUF1772 domain-containing protein [Gammaproteobacteria bacterium]
MLVPVLNLFAVLATGLAAGAMTAFALVVVTVYDEIPPSTYLQIHLRVTERMDKYMPAIALGSICIGLLLLGLTNSGFKRSFFGLAVICVLACSVISRSKNVPIDRIMGTWNETAPPAETSAFRGEWKLWHRIRTGCMVAAMISFLVATQ